MTLVGNLRAENALREFSGNAQALTNLGGVASAGGAVAATTILANSLQGVLLSSKFAQVFKVTDYGAIGDGSSHPASTVYGSLAACQAVYSFATALTNELDGLAIQLAINNAAGNGHVHIPQSSGQYLVSLMANAGGLAVPSNSHIINDGYVMQAAGANTNVFFVNGSTNVFFDGTGTYDANRSAYTGTTGNAGIYIKNCTNVLIGGFLNVTNCRNFPLNVVGSTNVLFQNTRCTSSGNSVEFAAESTNCWASNLYISGINDEGFSFYGGVTNSGISGSVITGSNASGISVLCDSGQPAACSNIIIQGNLCIGNQLDGIEVAQGSGGTGIHSQVIIDSNILTGNNQVNQGFSGGVRVGTGEIISVTNNLSYENGNGSNGAIGYSVGAGATAVKIQNNFSYNEGQGSTVGVGINVLNNNNCLISGNMVADTQTTKTMAFGMTGTCGAKTVISDNFIGTTIGASYNVTLASDTVFSTYNVGVTGGGFTQNALTLTGLLGGVNATLTGLVQTLNLTVTGASLANTLVLSGLFRQSVGVGLTATGTTQGTALALTAQKSVIASTPTGTGVILPASVGSSFTVFNEDPANTLLVYPPTGAAIGAAGTNVGVNLTALSKQTYDCVSATQFY